MHETWDTVKRSNLQIIDIEKEEETLIKIIENIFSKIMEENFPNIKKERPIKVHEAYRTPSIQEQKRNSP